MQSGFAEHGYSHMWEFCNLTKPTSVAYQGLLLSDDNVDRSSKIHYNFTILFLFYHRHLQNTKIQFASRYSSRKLLIMTQPNWQRALH